MRALIKVGYQCNNNCVFCHSQGLEPKLGPNSLVLAKIEKAVQKGAIMVAFSGGEPTIRPELVKWAKYCQQRGIAIGLITNGRMLSYKELTRELVDLGLKYVHIGLHGATARQHNSIVGSESFNQVLPAIENLAKLKVELVLNTVITPLNLNSLVDIFNLLRSFQGIGLKFSMAEPKGAAYTTMEKVVPHLKKAAEKVIEVFTYAQKRANGWRLCYEGIPFCLLKGWEHLYGGLRQHGFYMMSEAYETAFYPVDDRNKMKTKRCENCTHYEKCPGLYTNYFETYGDNELQPYTRLSK